MLMEVIDLNSFSNLWFWIALAALWSSATHWVLGVPWDLVLRAQRKGGQHMLDVEALVRVNRNRSRYIRQMGGVWHLIFVSAVVSALFVLGFVYRLGFFQALFLLSFPMCLVAALSVRTSERIAAQDIDGADLLKTLRRHRFALQSIGLISMFITATWGMYQNLNISVLGN